MARYPAQSLEEKLAWMRERMRRKSAAEPRPVRRAISSARYRSEQSRAAETAPAHLRMYRVAEVAELLRLSPDSVRRLFEGRVAVWGETKTTKSRRRKRIFLISQRDIEEKLEELRGRG